MTVSSKHDVRMRMSFPLLLPSIYASHCGSNSPRVVLFFLLPRRGRGRFSGACGAMVLQDDGIPPLPFVPRLGGRSSPPSCPGFLSVKSEFLRFTTSLSPFYPFLSNESEEPKLGVARGRLGPSPPRQKQREVSREDSTPSRKDLSTPQLRAASTPAHRHIRRREPKRKAAKIACTANPRRGHDG